MKTLDLFEARSPDINYTTKKKKGQIDRVIAHLEGDESGRFTRIANRYRRLKRITDLLKVEKEKLNEEVTDKVTALFDAEDEIYTRVVETISLTLTLSKENNADVETFDVEGYVEELESLLPQFGELFENLRAKYTSIDTVERKAALRVKQKDTATVADGGSKRGKRRVYESDDALLDKIEEFADKSGQVIEYKLKGIDQQIDAIRAKFKRADIL